MRYTADLETTTQPDDCRVWAWGMCQIDTLKFEYGNDLKDFIEICKNPKDNPTVYYHNLKFDGIFLIDFLFKNGYKWVKSNRDFEDKTFTTLISDMNLFYSITICFKKRTKNNNICTILDSMKLYNMSVKDVAKTFNLPIEKGSIDYTKYRKPGHVITENEKAYLQNDCEIMARALQYLFNQGLMKNTIGSNALFDFKRIFGKSKFNNYFPVPDYNSEIKKGYKGGYTYLDDYWKNKKIPYLIALDVNSLYPYIMADKYLPYGEGVFFNGIYKKDVLHPLFVQKFKCDFELKPGKLPTIQLKGNLSFNQNEYLKTSNNEYPTLTLTNIDLKLFLEHYNVYNIDYISGYKFRASKDFFKVYVDKWVKVKTDSKIEKNWGLYAVAKIMLNSLYGKLASSDRAQSKEPYLHGDGLIKFKLLPEETKKPVYLPGGMFITAWARYITISAGQACNDKYGDKTFIYADTDSLKLYLKEPPDILEIDDLKLGAWKHEFTVREGYGMAKFLRQKSYYIIGNEPGNTKRKKQFACAGMPSRCHKYVTFNKFREGKKFYGCLKQKRVPGGTILIEDYYTIKTH